MKKILFSLFCLVSNAAAISVTGGGSGSFVDSTKVSKAGDTMTGQLTLNSSTLTITGNAFSVGTSTLAVSGGLVGIGNSNPQLTLDVAGASQFGSTAKSSFTSSGALLMAAGSSITLSGANGFVTSGSSITASAFFGDASNLSNMSDTTRVSKAGDTMTGALTLNANPAIKSTNQAIVVISTNFQVNGGTMSIMSGRLGIDTSLPAQKLHLSSGSLLIDGNVVTTFQIGSSSFIITASSVGIGTSNPGSLLDINGGASFRNQVTIAASSLTITGAAGYIKTSSSITASGFFGDGSGLTNVSASAGNVNTLAPTTGTVISGLLGIGGQNISTNAAGGFVISSMSFTATGSSVYAVNSATGIAMAAGSFQWPALAATGFAGALVPIQQYSASEWQQLFSTHVVDVSSFVFIGMVSTEDYKVNLSLFLSNASTSINLRMNDDAGSNYSNQTDNLKDGVRATLQDGTNATYCYADGGNNSIPSAAHVIMESIISHFDTYTSSMNIMTNGNWAVVSTGGAAPTQSIFKDHCTYVGGAVKKIVINPGAGTMKATVSVSRRSRNNSF